MTSKIIREVARTGLAHIESLYGTLEEYLELSWGLTPRAALKLAVLIHDRPVRIRRKR